MIRRIGGINRLAGPQSPSRSTSVPQQATPLSLGRRGSPPCRCFHKTARPILPSINYYIISKRGPLPYLVNTFGVKLVLTLQYCTHCYAFRVNSLANWAFFVKSALGTVFRYSIRTFHVHDHGFFNSSFYVQGNFVFEHRKVAHATCVAHAKQAQVRGQVR